MSFSDIQNKVFTSSSPISRQVLDQHIKRLFDLFLAILILPFILLVIAVLYIAVRRDGGTGFFGHVRVGKDNRDFKCWKIRTMVPNAEKVLDDYLVRNPQAAAEWERDFKLSDDPRITRLGRFLRSSSLDELPQIWNVLRGEMSFVGPRPVTRKEMAKYEGFESCYLSVKPGITGLWQVSGRNEVSYEERVRMDMDYFKSRTMIKDISIIVRTAGAIVNRTGR